MFEVPSLPLPRGPGISFASTGTLADGDHGDHVFDRGKTVELFLRGKPWENHRKTIGKSQLNGSKWRVFSIYALKMFFFLMTKVKHLFVCLNWMDTAPC